MKSVKILLVSLVAILGLSTFAYAEVPKMINYQGKITKPNGALIDTTTSMVFSIYADTGGTLQLWTETQPSVDVQFGVFSVLLGSVSPIPDSVFKGNLRYLGVKVGSDSEMTPRKAIVSVGYAYHSGTADTAYFAMPDADWTIDGDNIYHLNGNVGIGTTNPQVKLQVDSGIVSFTHQSAVSVDNITSFNVPHGVSTKIPYSSESFDNQNEYDPSTNYRFTAAKTGDYLVCASLAAPSSFSFTLAIYKNGVLERGFAQSVGIAFATGCQVIHLEANEYIEMFVYQVTGSTKTFSPDDYWSWLTINKIN